MGAGRYLNIGCGATFHPAWVNVDLVSSSPHVRAHDIRNGLPFPAASFDACYHSHLLEHLTPAQAEHLLRECHRVLAPAGVVRVVVPDLEAIAREYLAALERVLAGEPGAEADHRWMVLELYDQTVRSTSGGEAVRYLADPAISNPSFIVSRWGAEAETFWNEQTGPAKKPLWRRIRSKNLRWWVGKLRRGLALGLVQIAAGRAAREALREGLFRNSGEIHRWMYDRVSLRRLLETAGFSDVRVCRPDESRIPGFNSYELDAIGGRVRKPDSLFMEGIKA